MQNDSSSLTVGQLAEQYLADVRMRCQMKQISRAGLEKIERYMASFLDMFGQQRFIDCRKSDLTRWLLAHPELKSDHTKQDAIRTVIVCFNWLHSENVVTMNPYRNPKGLKLVCQPRMPFFEHEYKQLMNHLRQANISAFSRPGARRCPSATALRICIYFLWRTGARTCEMREAQWQHMDWGAGVLRMKVHKTMRTGEMRIIPLDPHVLRLVRFLYRHRRKDQTHIFLNGWGGLWTKDTFARIFRTHAQKAGLDKGKTAYSLRHGFCVQAIEKGVPERSIADIMGHLSTKQIDWYGRQSRQHADYLRRASAQANGTPDQDPSAPAPTEQAAPKPERYRQKVTETMRSLYEAVEEARAAHGLHTDVEAYEFLKTHPGFENRLPANISIFRTQMWLVRVTDQKESGHAKHRKDAQEGQP